MPRLTGDELSEFCQAYRENVSRFGFEVKMITTERPEQCVYLGKRPQEGPGGYRWAPTLGRCLYKIGFVQHRGPGDHAAIMRGVMEMHKICHVHVPILADLAERYCQLRPNAKRIMPQHDPNREWEWAARGGSPYGDMEIESMARAYSYSSTPQHPIDHPTHITAADIRAVIAEIRSIPRFPYVLDSPILRAMIQHDDL